ncbi:MAG: flagellar export chaperone FliS [Gemmatimonadota bacterium]|nr:flagellar export chaperone FliS [Gemmatimonadota bacterium]
MARPKLASMGYSAYTSKYLENDVVSRSKEWLVPLLYEHLLAHLRRAAVQIQQRDFEGKAASLEKASAIVIELMGSLDREKGGELAQRLSALYAYFGTEILAVGRTLDVVRLTKIMEMASSLHESWVIAARTQWPAGASAQPGDSLYDSRGK